MRLGDQLNLREKNSRSSRASVGALGWAHGSEHQVVTPGTIPDGFDVITSWSHPAPFGNTRTQTQTNRAQDRVYCTLYCTVMNLVGNSIQCVDPVGGRSSWACLVAAFDKVTVIRSAAPLYIGFDTSSIVSINLSLAYHDVPSRGAGGTLGVPHTVQRRRFPLP
jgi:hypothetical protein